MGPLQLVVYGLIGFAMSILSGIAGAGGGFVTTPLAILLGLSPAQAISSGKFGGLATSLGSLSGLRKYPRKTSKRLIFVIMCLALVVGLAAPLAIKSFDGHWYRLAIGIIILAMLPVMLYKRVGIRPRQATRLQQGVGGVMLSVTMFLQGTFGSGLSSLTSIVLMGMFGMTANEAQITKRWSQLVLNITIIFSVVGTGLIVWPVVVIGIATGLTGSFVGAHIAVKRGDEFAVNILLILMVVSGLALIFSAL